MNTPAEAREYEELGFPDPIEVRLLVQMGQERAHVWYTHGVRLQDGHSYRGLIDDEGYPVQRVAAIVANPKTGGPDYKEAWVRSNVPVDQISAFVDKGYTPRQAASQTKRGVTAKKAPDLRNGEPVPGKGWKEIKDAVTAKAKKENCDLDISTEELRGGWKSITVTLADKTDPTKTTTYKMTFSPSGSFEEGRSNIKRKTRLLSSRAAFMRLHFPE